MSFHPQTWFITGAARGIGAQTVQAALAAGHNVVATARKRQSVASAHERLLVLDLDVTDELQAHAAVHAAVKQFGRIDVLVNNAGYGQMGLFEEVSPAQAQSQFDTNVFGLFQVTRAVLPVMRLQRAGHVFNLSSVGGIQGGYPGASLYCASKFAVEGFTEAIAQEVSDFGIKVTIIEPGFFRTDFLDARSVRFGDIAVADYAGQSAEFRASYGEYNHQQPGDPARLASTILQLAAHPTPPLRFAAGSDAVAIVTAKIDALQAELENWRALSVMTDHTFEGTTQALPVPLRPATWFITGAARGIGAQTVEAALAAGHNVVATARSRHGIVAQHDRLLALDLDVTDEAQASIAVHAAIECFGRIDVLVNNAGYGQLGLFEESTSADAQRQFDTNVFGLFHVTRAVLPVMRKQQRGHILNISSMAGMRGRAGTALYSASKFAVEGFSEALAQEVAAFGIRITVVEPGAFRTDFLDPRSMRYGSRIIEDYASISSVIQQAFGARNHQQPGDAARLAGVLLQLAAHPTPPLRLAAGSDAVEVVSQKVESLREEVQTWHLLSVQTDIKL